MQVPGRGQAGGRAVQELLDEQGGGPFLAARRVEAGPAETVPGGQFVGPAQPPAGGPGQRGARVHVREQGTGEAAYQGGRQDHDVEVGVHVGDPDLQCRHVLGGPGVPVHHPAVEQHARIDQIVDVREVPVLVEQRGRPDGRPVGEGHRPPAVEAGVVAAHEG